MVEISFHGLVSSSSTFFVGNYSDKYLHSIYLEIFIDALVISMDFQDYLVIIVGKNF